MGLVNRIRSSASKAADTARKAAEAARRAAEAAQKAAAEAARKAAAKAQKEAAERAAAAKAAAERNRDVFEGVKDKVGEAAHRLQGAAKTTANRVQETRENVADAVRGGVKTAKSTARNAAEQVVSTQQKIVDAGLDAANAGWQAAGDGVRKTLHNRLDVVDRGLEALERVTPDKVDRVIDKAQQGIDLGHKALNLADRVQENVGSGVTTLAKSLNVAVGNAVLDPVGTLKAGAREANEAVNLLQVEDRLGELGTGDTFELTASIDGSFMSGAARLNGTQKITRNQDGSYTLRVTGEAGAGVMSRMGTSAAGGEASAFIHGGATVEFKFDTAAQAADAARGFMGPQAGALSGLIDGGVKEAVDGATFNPEIFRENLSAVELNAGLSGELSGQLGIVSGKLTGRADVSARIEFNSGKPDQVVLLSSANVTGKGTASIPGLEASAGANGKVTVEQRFDLPEGLNALDVARDPKGTTARIARSAVDTGQLSITLSGSANAGISGAGGKITKGAGNLGGQLDASFKLTGSTREIIASGGLTAAFEGDFEGALNKLAPVVKAEGSVTPVASRDLGFSVKGGDGLNSLGVGFNGKITDKQDPLTEFCGTVQEVQQRLAEALASGVRVPR